MNSSKILFLGANGMFGKDAQELLFNLGYNFFPVDIPEVDITEKDSLEEIFLKTKPQIVINAAAFTDVDGSERERDTAYKVNCIGAKNVAAICKKTDCFLVHISTDYVFPGTKREGYLPNDETGPAINYYGETKLMGEKAIIEYLSKEQFLICRTQWLYGKNGKNFVKTIIKIAQEKKEIDVVDDQWGAPTWTKDLIEQIVYLLEKKHNGFAHTVGGGGPITWFRFAKEIVEMAGIKCRVNPITSDKLKREAKRPMFGFLKNDIIPDTAIRNYRESLKIYLKEEKFI